MQGSCWGWGNVRFSCSRQQRLHFNVHNLISTLLPLGGSTKPPASNQQGWLCAKGRPGSRTTHPIKGHRARAHRQSMGMMNGCLVNEHYHLLIGSSHVRVHSHVTASGVPTSSVLAAVVPLGSAVQDSASSEGFSVLGAAGKGCEVSPTSARERGQGECLRRGVTTTNTAPGQSHSWVMLWGSASGCKLYPLAAVVF